MLKMRLISRARFRHKAFSLLWRWVLASILILIASSTRTDQVGSEIKASNEGVEGTWKTIVYCPSGSYVTGYSMRVENNGGNDQSAMNSAQMACYDLSGNYQAYINSHIGFWGDWYDFAYCPIKTGYMNFMNGYRMLQGDQTSGAHGMRGKCLSDDELEAPGKYTDSQSTWGGWGMCPKGTAICGFQSKVEDPQGTWGNDSALNHILIFCCRLCDPDGGVFLSGNTCEKCYYKCKTCSGSLSNNCNSCYFTSTHVQSLTAGTCQYPSYEYIIASQSPPSGWTSSPTSATSSCGYFGTILGGYNVFGSGAFSKSSFTNIPPFFRVRVWFILIKIDSWESEAVKVDVNSALKFTSPAFTTEESRYTASQCGEWTNELSRNFFFEYDDSTSTNIEIKFYSNLDEDSSNESWGIAFFGLSVLTCHVTCRTCLSQNSNSCLSCYDHASKQADNSCLCDDTYFAVTTSPCTISVCTEFRSCYTGCRKCTDSGSTSCQSCIEGFYLSDKTCKTCESTCATCSAAANTNCRSCSASASRFHQHPTPNVDGMCLSTCISPHLYAHFPTRRCHQRCPPPTWGVLSAKACVDHCPGLNYYKLADATQRNCLICDSSCATCSGPSNSQCLSCSGPLYFYGGFCLSFFGSGKYGDSADHLCKECTSPCKECITPSQPSVCTACRPNKFLKANECVDSCDLNQFKDYTEQACKSCHADCLSCSGPSEAECLSCSSPKYLNEVKSSCVQPCPAPQYAYVDIVSPAIRKCVFTCPAPLYGNNSTGTCDSNCVDTNEFRDNSDKICKICHSSCGTCFGPLSSNCLSCLSPRFLNKNNECVLDCAMAALNYYGSSNDKKCHPCQIPCLKCETPDGAANCLSCQEGYFLYGKTCLKTCPPKYFGAVGLQTCEVSCLGAKQYGDNTDRICKSCPTRCLSCDETGCMSCPPDRYLFQRDCLLCGSGYWLDRALEGPASCRSCLEKEEYLKEKKECIMVPFFLDENKCVETCPLRKYRNIFTRRCESCDSNCESCETRPKKCLSCAEGKFVNSSQMCEMCDCKCLSCDLTAKNCTKCHSKYFLGTDGQCVEKCSLKSFANISSRKCESCDSNCESCETQPKKCLSCSEGKFLNASQMCEFCDANCHNCYFSGKNCTKCHSEYFLDIDSRICTKVCLKADEFPDAKQGICMKCSSSCKSCSSFDACTSCSGSLFLLQSNNSCVPSCGTTFYGEETQRICERCDLSCLECNGNKRNCTMCYDSYFLYFGSCLKACPKPYFRNPVSRKCELICSDIGQYGDPSDMACKPCDSSCLSCQNNSTECTSCPINKFILDDEKKCVESCPEPFWGVNFTRSCEKECLKNGEYGDFADRTCKACIDYCHSCSNYSECTSCKFPNLLQIDKTCEPKCKPLTYLNNNTRTCSLSCLNSNEFNNTNGFCELCDNSCASCHASGPENCKSCYEGDFLFNGACGKKCPENFIENIFQGRCTKCLSHQYEVNQNGLFIKCSECEKPCESCFGSEKNCTSCQSGHYLNPNNICEKSCIQGFFPNKSSGVCEICHSGCRECFGSRNESCSGCFKPEFLHKTLCLKKCPDGYYGDQETLSCKACHFSCKNCDGPKDYHCLEECFEQRYFLEQKKNSQKKRVLYVSRRLF